ncbi:MAG: hypothetical protein RMN51_07495 [Verrucomicrobiota bacterium]|nr:hypothetical protein [Verrucomicrobiota bacterium]
MSITTKRLLSGSLEARHLVLQHHWYKSKRSSLKVGFGFTDWHKDTCFVPIHVFVNNDPVLVYDPDGFVAQWLAGCAIGCFWGGIGGAFGGIAGGGKGVKCGAVGGAINGCCSGSICTSLPAFCIVGSCICGLLASIAEQACLGNLNYKDPSVWLSVSTSGVAGCLGGMAEAADEATAKVVAFAVGVDIAALVNLCGE